MNGRINSDFSLAYPAMVINGPAKEYLLNSEHVQKLPVADVKSSRMLGSRLMISDVKDYLPDYVLRLHFLIKMYFGIDSAS